MILKDFFTDFKNSQNQNSYTKMTVQRGAYAALRNALPRMTAREISPEYLTETTQNDNHMTHDFHLRSI